MFKGGSPFTMPRIHTQTKPDGSTSCFRRSEHDEDKQVDSEDVYFIPNVHPEHHQRLFDPLSESLGTDETMPRRSSLLTLFSLSIVCSVPTTGGCQDSQGANTDLETQAATLSPESWRTVVSEVDAIIQSQFCFPDRIGQEWKNFVLHTAPKKQPETLEELGIAVNHGLQSLRTSHTALFTLEDPELYEILGVFNQTPGVKDENLKWLLENQQQEFGYAGIGLRMVRIDRQWFVRDFLPASPALMSDLQIGDRLISADDQPFHPWKSFRDKKGQSVRLQVERQGAKPLEKQVEVQWYSPDTMFHQAIDQSIEINHYQSHKIGYIRMWSYAGKAYHDRLSEHLLQGTLSECDALVLDLRGGWGGASTSFLSLFDRRIPTIAMIKPTGERSVFPSTWTRPVVLLIDETVRSGKEAFAYGFKKLELGPVVGRKTAGTVPAGMTIKLSHGCLLYCAVAQCEVDGIDLEGVGVEPTIDVDWDWRHCDGVDVIKQRGIEEAQKLLR